MKGIGLDENALQIQLGEQLPEHRSLVIAGGGVAGLADGYAQCGRIQRYLGNEHRATCRGGLNRSPQGLAVTHQLIEIRCATLDLGHRPVTDRRAQRRQVHRMEEVAERGIRWWPPKLDTQRLGEHAVVADGKTLQIPQALTAAQDSEHRHQQQIPSRKLNPARHLRIWDRPQITDQVEIGCGGSAFKHK